MKWYEDPKKLRKARAEVALSQAALAKAAGVKRSLIANIESGRRPFSREAQKPIWKALARAKSDLKLHAQAMGHTGQILRLADLLSPIPPPLLRVQAQERAADTRALIKLQQTQIVELQAEIERLQKQNSALREWLDSEEQAALAHEKAADLAAKESRE